MVATIVIVNFDGKHLLAECLPAVIEAVKCAGGNHEILVVDNGSADGSAQFVQENFPEVRLLALDQNYGFTGGNNRAAQSIETDIIVFLNNDMVVDRGFLQPLLGPFSDPSVFAVTCQIFFADATRRREEKPASQIAGRAEPFRERERGAGSPHVGESSWCPLGSSK